MRKKKNIFDFMKGYLKYMSSDTNFSNNNVLIKIIIEFVINFY